MKKILAMHLELDEFPQALPKQLAPTRLPCVTPPDYLPLLPSGPDGV